MLNSALRNFARVNYHGIRRAVRHAKNKFTDRAPKLIVLAYHRVLPETGDNLLNTAVSVKTFSKQIESISKNMKILPLSEAAAKSGGRLPGDGIIAALTFDDAYSDNYSVVFPLLKKKGISASFFVPTGYAGKDIPMWDYEVVERISRSGVERIEAGDYRQQRRVNESGLSFAFRVFNDLKSRDFHIIDEALTFLRRKTPGIGPGMGRCMSWEEIKELSEAGMEIGSHAVTHRSLARIPLPEAAGEIRRSKADIEEKTGAACLHFAFPFGSRLDYNSALVDEVRKAGYSTCILNIHGYNRADPGIFTFKRIIMEEHTDTRFILG
ncbi:MAG: polysaccharide deacetylase family protein [Candidatus Omnitrophota bacterium]